MKQFKDKFLSVLLWTVITLCSVMDGHFGSKVLKQPYRDIWRVLCWAVFIYVFFIFISVPLLRWWSKMVTAFNYVIWG